jgi:S-adenosylmethionine hydrolase
VPYDCITLLTDYGYGGGFVGALHAVALGIAPGVPVIDLDHAIPPQDVRLGALRLERLIAYTPPGVHVAVVDPGVGGDRRPLAVETAGRVFVGPDNGLLVWAAERCGPLQGVTVLEEQGYWLSPRSRTFDGRDVFVPVAARLATGLDLAKLGPRVDPGSLVTLDRPAARRQDDGSLLTEVVQVDTFGNVQFAAGGSGAAGDVLGLLPGTEVHVEPAGGAGAPVEALVGFTFDDVPAGTPVLLVDSDGCLALSVNRGRADELSGLQPGDLVTIRASGGALR